MNPKNVSPEGLVRSDKPKKTSKKAVKTKKPGKGKTWAELNDLLLDYSGFTEEHDLDAPTFVISLAAQMAGMHPQTLRQYDRLGLVQPQRTRGGGRRYSPRDLAKLRYVQKLSQELGVNLTGIQLVLELNDKVNALEAEIQELRREIRAQTPVKNRVFMADGSGKVLQRARNLRVGEPVDDTDEINVFVVEESNYGEGTGQSEYNASNISNPNNESSGVATKEIRELPGRSPQEASRSELVVWGESSSPYGRFRALMRTILRRDNSK